MFESHSLIFRMGYLVVFFISQLLAVYLFLRGHNLPGGGFIGGLVSALALVVLSFDIGVARVKALLRFDPFLIAAVGLGVAIASALAGPFVGGFFMQHFNGEVEIPFVGNTPLGTPLVFDAGVFLVVVGVFTKIAFALSDAASGKDPLQGVDARRYVQTLESGDDVDAS
ncbi:MAG: Na(+)/H(+) antiporter subunit B [Silvanigrellales bacterium]|jgi:multisubunit Na+/H+ antiporter MnhB subunit|nr:Na(+)/H(+) antiporter subunit B [Silvanigrellales bacterium]